MIAVVEAARAGLFARRHWAPNLIAGLVVGVVSLPLSMAFAIASGVKPEQGLITGIVAGAIVAPAAETIPPKPRRQRWQSLRGECRPYGVRVVTLLPGYVSTPLTAKNPYPMPFQMSAEAFAERALRAIEAGTSYRVIPWQMGVVAKLLRLLPNALFDRVLAGRPRKHRQGE